MKTAIVSAADADFFAFLQEMLQSIEQVRPPGAKDVDLCVLDVGMTDAQRGIFGGRVTHIKDPGWDLDFPARSRTPRVLQAMFSRPFIPRHFPGYDIYIYLDADLWLQDWKVIDVLIQVARKNALAIVPEVHHAYASMYRQREGAKRALHAQFGMMYESSVAQWLAAMAAQNSGVFAMHRSCPGWTAWAEDLQDALMRVDPVQPLVEQCSLNHAIYTGKVPFSPLAAKFNWICAEALPVWDSQRNLLCDPSIPHDPLSIIHLNDLKAMPVEINCTDGSVRQTQLTWSAIQGLKFARVRSGVSPLHTPGP